MTTDLDGKRAFVMTMRAREQDIRREKAASNICTNQALLALAASVYLATLGPHGLRDVAALGAARAAELEAALAAVGARRLHPGPYLNEFAVRVPDAPRVHRTLLERGVLAGLVLAEAEPDDPSLADALLVCATEVTTPDEIARFATALSDTLNGRPPVAVEAGAGTGRGSTAGTRPRSVAGGSRSAADERHREPPPADDLREVAAPGGAAARSRTRRRTRSTGSRPPPAARRRPRCRSSTSPRSSATTST